MTRKNLSEIVSPLSNPKRVFCTLKKKEQVVESEGTSQQDFEFESTLESEFQTKNEEEMGDDDRTMADLDKTTRTRASSAITRPALTVDNFKYEGQFLHMILNQCQFSGALGEDVNDHINTFLGIYEVFKIKDVDGDAIKLHVFPFTLTGIAKEWLKSNAPGSITTWDQMQERLLARFFPPMSGETLYEAWERLKKYLCQCPQHGLSKHKIVQTFYKGIDRHTRNTIDNSAGGMIMHKTPNEAYKLIEYNAVHMHEWYAPQYGVSKRATSKAVEADGVSEIVDLTNQMAMFNKNFDKLNATVVRMLVGCESCSGPHLTRDCDDKLMSSSKDACWVNQRQGNFQSGGSNGNTSYKSGKQTTDPFFPSNENVINPVNQEENDKYAKLGLGEPKLTRMTIQLADGSIKYLRGIMENVLVKVDRFVFLVDFVILDIDEDSKVPFILGRPFLEFHGIFEEVLFETNFSGEDMNMSSEENDSSSRSNKEEEIKSGTRGKLKMSFEEPLVFELKDLPPHLGYAFLESESKLPVFISSDLTEYEKEKLIEVLKENKDANAYNIKGINPSCCTHKIHLSTNQWCNHNEEPIQRVKMW
nr:hypothetical protein [Tanacetum cinerariifolium]